MAGGSGWQWQRIRQRILTRDNYECQHRLKGCTVTATVIDHIIGVRAGGSDDASNLVASCQNCNVGRGG